jgi:hypothetical protein
MTGAGLEQGTVSPENLRSHVQSGAPSGARHVAAAADPELQALVDAWPTLPPDVRRAIAGMAQAVAR